MSDAENYFSDYLRDIGNFEYRKDLERSKELSERHEVLVRSFRGFNAPNYNQRAYIELLSEMEEFEKDAKILEIMQYFYGYMGRVALNSKDVVKAMMYALAGLELCSDEDDEAGIWANKMLICDIALSVGSNLYASIFYKDCNEGEPVPFPVTESKAEDERFKKLLSMKKRPVSFSAFSEKEAMEEERAIRMIMSQLKVSRRTAKKYVDDAKKNDLEDFD